MTSTAPGQYFTSESLLAEPELAAAPDLALNHTIAAILAEQHRRALSGGDLDAQLEQAFLDGFTGKGEPGRPWITGGLLFCPGMRRDKSATSHECCFVSVDGRWVWEVETVADVMRQVPGPRTLKQSITVVHAVEGMTFDVVASASRSGSGCQMRKASSYQIRSGQLVETATRARAPQGHSR
jgi:hypothetical protein